jgi:mono/diheme cytochrome c family protein
MSARAKFAVLGFVAGFGGVVALLAAVGLYVVYSGSFNVAATEEHNSFVRWAFNTTFQNSVESRAADIPAPERLSPARVASGAVEYKAMCQHCHGGPGIESSDWANGMRPKPPALHEAAKHWEPREVFWLTKHGVKMSGMPAFGPTHDDRTLWSIAAFVNELPAMTPEKYKELTAAAGETGTHGSGGHSH